MKAVSTTGSQIEFGEFGGKEEAQFEIRGENPLLETEKAGSAFSVGIPDCPDLVFSCHTYR
jgi:hypothetical protein